MPSRLILTDADADALVNLTANLAANDVAVGEEEKDTNTNDDSRTKQNAVHVTTARLDWEDFHEDTLRAYRTDLIVASDVLYDPLNITPLLNVCGCLLGVDEESFGDGDNQNHNQTKTEATSPGTTSRHPRVPGSTMSRTTGARCSSRPCGSRRRSPSSKRRRRRGGSIQKTSQRMSSM